MCHSKFKYNMKNILATLLFIISSFISGCSGFLDMVPEKDIETIESIFEIESSAFEFYNSCFSAVHQGLSVGDYSQDPAMICGGEYATGEFGRSTSPGNLKDMLSISDGNQNTYTPVSDMWSMYNPYGKLSVYACIRYCNTFIENIDKVNDMSIWKKDAWKAEIKCLKAFYYFELMKRYGPIVLVPNNIQVNANVENIQLPRSHVDTCFNEIVRLFDEAIPDLRVRNQMPSDFLSCFNKEAALAYKARVLLYAASPLFNGNPTYSQFKNRDGKPLFSSTYDNEKWKLAAEAADVALKVTKENGIDLYRGVTTEKTKKLNDINTIRRSVLNINWLNEYEWLFMQLGYYAVSLQQNPRYKQGEKLHHLGCYGQLAPNISTVELFYSENGVPISKDKTWPYANRYQMSKESNTDYAGVVKLNTEILNLHLRREPRFYANIASAGTYDIFENVKETYLVEPFKGQSRGTEANSFNDGSVAQNITGYWSRKFIDPVKKISDQSIVPFVLMRMADLYLMQAEAWNEYSGPSDKVYNAIDEVRARAGIPNIREAWMQCSVVPDEIKTKDGLRNAIHQERMIEFVFEGQHFWDLRRWKKAELVLNEPHKGWNIMGADAKTFFNNFTGPIVVSRKPKFTAPRDYFWPIKSEDIMISNIVQNPGW